MTGHFDVELFGNRNHYLQEIRDPFPVVFNAHHTGLAHRQILPILLELEARVSDFASPGSLPVAPDRNHGPVIGDDADGYARCLLDVANDPGDLAIALRPFTQRDVVWVHAAGLELHAGLIARVFHFPQLFRVPAAVRGALPNLRGEVPYAVAQVVLQVFLRGDARSGDAVIVAAHVH